MPQVFQKHTERSQFLQIHHGGDVVEPMPLETLLTQAKSGNLFELLVAKHGRYSKPTGVSRPPYLDDKEWRDSRGHNIEARTGGNSLHECYFFISLVSSNL
jgi:hypothetical protein